MSNTTVTNAIRTALKAAGFNARQVTVKDRSYGDIKVTVRDSSVPLSAVKALAEEHINVRRCESTGEILLGGNTYVEVKYLPEVVSPIAATVAAMIATSEPGYQVKLAGGFVATRYSDTPWHQEVRWSGPGADHMLAIGVDHAAAQIAEMYLDTRAQAALAQAAQAA